MSRLRVSIVAILVLLFFASVTGVVVAGSPVRSLEATALQLPQDDDHGIEVKFETCLQAVDLNESLVGTITTDEGFVIQVTEQTEIRGVLSEGVCVKVEARLELDSSEPPALILVATEIKVKDREGGEGRCLEFYGELQSRDDEWHVVGGPPFVVDGRTEYEPGADEIVVGQTVKVEICRQGNVWVAKKIRVLRDGDDGDDGDEREFRGRILDILPGNPPFRQVLQVAQWKVGIDDHTEMHGTPAVGRIARVEGRVAPADSEVDVIADEVTIQGRDRDAGDVKIQADITGMDDTTWEFEGIPVTVDEDTRIDEDDPPADIGVWTEVRAVEQEDGSYRATRIKTEDEDEPDGTVFFEGRFDEVTDSTDGGQMWRVSNWEFFVPTDLLPSASPNLDDQVELKAMREDGTTVYIVYELHLDHEDDD